MGNGNWKAVAALTLLASCSLLWAAPPTIDGTADAVYGTALAVQDTKTGYGDSNLGWIDWANGSELDQAFGIICGDTLYLTLAGNLESNFNKVQIFIDSTSGGQNKLRGDNWNGDSGGLNRMGYLNDGAPGLEFDSGLDADFWIGITGGNPGSGTYTLFSNYAILPTNGSGSGFYLGSTGATSNGVLAGGDPGAPAIRITINNSNTGGVTAGTDGGSGAGVTTGIELAIPLAAIGNPTGTVKVCAFITNQNYDHVSNQVLGGIGGGANLGEPRTTSFANIAGGQYVSLEPSVHVTAWRSVRTHGSAGNLALTMTPGIVAIESRRGGPQNLEFDFNQAVAAADGNLDVGDVVVTNATATAATLTNGNTTLQVTLADVVDEAVCTIDIAGKFVSVADGCEVAGVTSLQINVLTGDANGDGTVGLVDIAAVRQLNRETASSANCMKDLNVDGQINLIDLALCRAKIGNSLP